MSSHFSPTHHSKIAKGLSPSTQLCTNYRHQMRTEMSTLFEIKIAVLGYVSAGKVTVINALLRDKYGQVSVRRTTAGVNYFRLSNGTGKRIADGSPTPSCSKDPPSSDSSSMEYSSENEYRTAESTLEEITIDNAAFRESTEIHAKCFDIDIDEPLCEMHDDTKLVVVDIPGINEAGAGGKYRAYVAENWTTFDCVIDIMDGHQGADTEEQVGLLEFASKRMMMGMTCLLSFCATKWMI